MDDQNQNQGQSPYYGSSSNQNSQTVYQNNTTNSGVVPPYSSYSAYSDTNSSGQGNNNGLSIVGMIFGILSIPTGCCYGAGIVFAIVGIICSAIGNKRNKSGMAIAGIVTSIIGIVISVVILICIVALFGSGLYDEILEEVLENGYYNYY